MKKILVVDDDETVRTSLTELLQGAGYQTFEASSGKEAVENAASEDFDLVLLDQMMPGMSGIDILTELKKISPRTRIIIITAFPLVENALNAVKRGASDYISKPFNYKELLTKIRCIIEETRFEKDIKLNVDNALNFLAHPVKKRIIKVLSSGNGMRLTDITREVDIQDHTKIAFHLRMLKEGRVIKQDKEKSYILTPEGEKLFKCLKMIENYLAE